MTVKVQPRPGIQGRVVGANGAARATGMLAEVLGVPARAVTVTLGRTGRDETSHVAGNAAVPSARLEIS